jgi:hypothetical protein
MTATYFLLILIVYAFLIVILLVYGYRNYWVYEVRMKLLCTDNQAYDNLISYEEMMEKWWIWDVKKLTKK